MAKPRTKKKKEPVAEFNIFACLICDKDEAGDHLTFDDPKAFVEHVQSNHPELCNEEGKVIGQKQMQSHMDATEWHQSDYLWLQGDKPFAGQSCRMARRGMDRAFWAED